MTVFYNIFNALWLAWRRLQGYRVSPLNGRAVKDALANALPRILGDRL
jgi:hypothetical protein